MKTLRFATDLHTAQGVTETKTSEGRTVLRVPALPEGEFDHQLYGKLTWTPEKFDRMIANFAQQVTGYAPMLNADHATHNPFAAEAPAYGWVQGLEKEPGVGLFAVVELTDLGEEAYRNRRYRYFSSEIAPKYQNSTGAEFEDVFSGIAFTNTPFHDTMPGLFSNAAALAQQLFRLGDAYSFEEIHTSLCEALRLEMPGVDCYVEEVYPDFFIYELWTYTGLGWTERYYRRGYTFADGKVTLAAATEAVEVEEVWVEKARQAMSQARQQARKLRQQQKTVSLAQSRTSEETAGTPARGRGMKNLIETLRRKLNLSVAEDATEEQVVQAVEAIEAPAQAGGEAEAAEQLSQAPAVTALSQQVATLSQTVTQLTTDLAAEKTKRESAEQTLSQKSAKDAIQAYVKAGKITPAQADEATDAGKALLAFALRDPVAFKAVYEAAAPAVDLNTYGVQPRGGEAAPVNFLAKVAEYQQKFSLDFLAASERAALDHPALYDAHRAGRN